MPSARIQRQIDRLLDEAEQAMANGDWRVVQLRCQAVLALDAGNEDAQGYLSAATGQLDSAVSSTPTLVTAPPADPAPAVPPPPSPALPTAFANGRYQVKRFLGEGGKKKVYLAHDTLLDRDVAFALIKTEGLDDAGRQRIQREAQAMGRLGSHPHIVSVFDLGEHEGQPYLVTELMGGGDVEGLIEHAPDHRVPLEQVLAIGQAICRGLASAHSHGIVHRDLKPGNVWLTADGVAKLGDFGLAVALDRSRLTQVGLMVGTVAYMPPEQALGGETSPQADLYSLGAMLYELVCGRPPFLADDPTAIITQHLTTAPVALSWLTDACPPDLEALILQLLAKRPEDRPASAEAVLDGLSRIDPSQRSASHSEAGANPLARLAQGVFVGREPELTRLRQVADAAFAGQGGLVLLVGEPGIGKTRTARELATYARLRGAQVLWGASHEHSGAPPYWPWLQVGRAWGAVNDPAQLRQALGSSADELVRLFPELRQVAGFAEPPPVTDPATAQFALFDAYAQFLRVASTRRPLLLVLDDLHWADKPTLLLLEHLARDLPHLRLLVVGTYRDTELSRTHPLSEALAALNRGEGFIRLVLRGLSRDEVAAYVRTTAGVAASPALLARLYEETEGNPFFLTEVVNLLTQEGTLTAQRVSDIRVPEGVKEALGRRLDRLSAETNGLLQVAALIGREFTYDTLTLQGEQDEDALLQQIEAAVGARVIEELPQPGRYRFTHALMQETLLGELSTTRRVRLQGQVGEVLERHWGSQAEARAARLAVHFGEAATLSVRHAGKAVHYAKLAAQQAEAQFAWAEAARQYERCLSLVSEAADKLGEDEAALLTALGSCYMYLNELRAAWRNLMRAVGQYRERGDGAGMARATLEAMHIVAPLERQVALVEGALGLLGQEEPSLEAALLAERAGCGLGEAGAEQAAVRAGELAEMHGYADVAARLTYREACRAMAEGRYEAAAAGFVTAHAQFVACGKRALAARALDFSAIALSTAGRLAEAAAAAERALTYARTVHARLDEQACLEVLGGIALAHRDEARCSTLIAALDAESFGDRLLPSSRLALANDLAGAVALLPAPEVAGNVPMLLLLMHGYRARVRSNAGDADGARRELAAWSTALGACWQNGLSETTAAVIHAYFPVVDQALVALGDDETVQAAYTQLQTWAALRFSYCLAQGVDHLRGDLALRLGLVQEAEGHYRTGLAWGEREQAPVEQGRCLQGLAEVAERQGDHAAALRHLDRAATLFQQQGVTFYLQQVLAKKDLLKA